MRPLPRTRTRLLVVAFVLIALALAVLAAALILRGWNDEGLQEHLRQLESEQGG